MKSQPRSSLKAIILGACLIFMAAAAGQAAAQSIGWASLGLASSAGPALSDHSDGKLYIAAVNKQGVMLYRSTDSPTGWTAWQQVSSGAPVFATDTSPVFVRDGSTLYLFARGADNNIYSSLESGNGRWSSWLLFSTGSLAIGRFSVAFTRCMGFTGSDYESRGEPSREHHFIYCMSYYFSDGDQLRQWVQEDLSHGDNLLKRKYDWIKQYIFRGVEFKTDNEPLSSRPPCTYSLSSTSQHFGSVGSGGGTVSVSLLTQEGCNWTAKSNAGWISITSSLSGSGSARINFSVTQNTTSANRTGTMTIAGQTVTVTQDRFVCRTCLPGSP